MLRRSSHWLYSRYRHLLKLLGDSRISLLLIILTLLISGFAFWQFLDWQQTIQAIPEADKRIQAETTSLATLAQILGGTFFLVSLYFTWRSVQVSQETQITERFSQAIDQLGDSNNLPKRIGGIYALERIAVDSEKDHWTIMEILTAYIRENTHPDTYEIEGKGLPAKTSSDIHAALRAIARRKLTYKQGEQHALDLRGLHLVGADFYEAHLEGVRLDNTNLEGASFRKAHLEGTRLRRAVLRQADFSRSYLYDARLAGSDMTGANLDNAHLEGVDLTDVIGLTHNQLSTTVIDEHTKLPAYLLRSRNYRAEDPVSKSGS